MTDIKKTDIVKKEEYLKLMNCEAIFESSPVAMFILDETTNIVMVNLAAVKLCGGSEDDIVRHRPGEAFRCIHSHKDPRGCGYSVDCKTCVVRNAIEGLISNGGSIHNAEVQLTVVRSDQPEKLWISVGVEPVNFDDLNYWCVAINDITEKKEIEIRLKDTLNLLKSAGRLAKFGGWNVVLSEDRCYWSDEVAAIHEMPGGYCPLVKDAINYYAPEWRAKITQVFTDCAQKGIPYDDEMEILTNTGKRVWVRTNGEAVRDEKGIIYKVQGGFQDITERKLNEEKFRETSMMLRSIFDQSPVGSVVVGLDKKFQKCNASFCRFIAYSEDELISKTISEITHPEDVNLGMNELKLMAEGRINNASVEKRYVRKDGSIVWGQVSISIVRDSNHEPLYFLPVIQDITDRKQAEKELKESEERFKNMFEHHSSIMLLVEAESGMIVGANEASVKFYGYSKAELLAMRIDEINILSPKQIKTEMEHAIHEERNYFEFPHRLASGEVRTVEVHSSPIVFHDQRVLFSIIHDITESKKAEETIKKRIEDLESFQKLIVGRELKMIELKKEVNELLKAMGKDEKYDS